ncbi:MAG: DUF4381 family protein, partial [Lentimicrobiaceae bacterium]|nr:DUF4381 family protein [Lentimicrobiaceae bacterium]
MKWHNIICIGLLSLFLTTSLFAQQTGKIENGFNVDEYPKVSFIYHSYNPDVLNKSNFWHLKEAGSNREFYIEELPVVISSLPQTTVILWEDMAHNGYGQFDFTQKVLSGFFNRAEIPTSDKFSISAFNRRKNTSSSLINLTNGFTNNKSQIVSAIQSYKHSTEHYPEFPNRSDMYTAIRESMELLAPLKEAKAIIVFTSGYSMKNSGSDSEAQVLLKAQQLHIPVYIFQYYYRSGVAPESEGFAKSTFGAFNSYMDVATAEAALLNLYPQISKRYQGHDYKVSFTADAKRGTEAHMITLSVDGVETQEQLLPPPHTFGTWIAAHPCWTVLFVVLLIALIVGIVLFIRKTKKNETENRRELADLEQRRLQDKEAAEQYQRNLENNVRQEQRQRESRERQAEDERLRRLMEVKNIFPR